MLYYKKEKIDEFMKNDINTIHIVADFDRTLTADSSETSWSILSEKGFMPENYSIERQRFYDEYRPIELDTTLDFAYKNAKMIEWWRKHLELFVKHHLSEKVVKQASENIKNLILRDNAKEFLKNTSLCDIPVLILSAGIGNFIEGMLKNYDCYYDNIFIVSNYIRFKDGIAIATGDNIIHSLNKNEAFIPDCFKQKIQNRPNIILMGDQLEDLRMISSEKLDNALKIGFVDKSQEKNLELYKQNYDIVGTDNTSFREILDVMNIFSD